MAWVAVGAAAVGVVGSAYQGSQNRKAAAKAAGQQASIGSGSAAAGAAGQQSRSDIEWVNDLNRKNAQWTQQQNAVAAQTDFGSTSYDIDPVTGKMTAKQSLAPEQQAMLGKLRGQQDNAIDTMDSSGFDVNNDVMNAYRAVNQPLVDQQRSKENARLAAMGLSTGSGAAWGNAQDTLNRNQVNSDQNAILQGNQAWLNGQQNNRANLAGLNSTEDMWQGNAPTLLTPQVAQPTVGQPQNATMQGFMADQNQANIAYDQNVANQNAQNGYTGQIAGIVGGLAGNKNVQNTVTNWWNTPATSTDNQWGYTGGSAGGTSTGFDW